jgi:hypothetical protein
MDTMTLTEFARTKKEYQDLAEVLSMARVIDQETLMINIQEDKIVNWIFQESQRTRLGHCAKLFDGQLKRILIVDKQGHELEIDCH